MHVLVPQANQTWSKDISLFGLFKALFSTEIVNNGSVSLVSILSVSSLFFIILIMQRM